MRIMEVTEAFGAGVFSILAKIYNGAHNHRLLFVLNESSVTFEKEAAA